MAARPNMIAVACKEILWCLIVLILKHNGMGSEKIQFFKKEILNFEF
jgi:hypothetical protein